MTWSDTNDSHILRLFCDYVFHQKDDQLHPVFEYSFIIDALAKLDAGHSSTIQLCSADGKTMLNCTYEDIRRSLENVYGDLLAQSSTMMFGEDIGFPKFMMISPSSSMTNVGIGGSNGLAGASPIMSPMPFAPPMDIDQRGFLPGRAQATMMRQSWM